MRIICDAPGQTCNRLWTYLASIAECVAQHRHMTILFYDWTIEDFPNLLHCPFIHFPLYQKWYLERGNGWNNYKGMTWKATHSTHMDKVFRMLGFIKGWDTRTDCRYLEATKKTLQHIYRPKKEITDKADTLIARIRTNADIIIGVHIRRGDYATWNDGRFFYSLEEYHRFMLRVKECYAERRVAFFISSNEDFPSDIFHDCECHRFSCEPSAAILDLYTLSVCDRIIGPFSTFSRWASFIGEVPLCFLENKEQQFCEESFSVITDYFHFANGKEIADW